MWSSATSGQEYVRYIHCDYSSSDVWSSEDPLGEVPPLTKQMMTTEADTTSTNLDLLLNKNRTPAKLFPSFVKAINKSHYTHGTSTLGGLTPMVIPHTLYGMGQENIDLHQLLSAKEQEYMTCETPIRNY